MLTEEIEEIIREHITPHKSRIGLGVTGAGVAAAAIAKRLSEGVVWEGQGKVATDMCLKDTRVQMIDSLGSFEIPDDSGRHGQLVEVTVKIVEGTKDE